MMNTDKRINMKQAALRAGVCLFMLSGTCVLSAQTEVSEPEESTEQTVAPVKKLVAPQYTMKEVSGVIYDAATKQPLPGVRVQALNNRFYSAMTDENGEYTISVPTFVTALYVATDDYNATHIALKGEEDQNAYINSSKVKGFYQDGTQLLSVANAKIDNSSAISIEEDLENTLNSSVRTINRGGLPGQGGAMFISGLNSLNINAQPLVVIDGVIWDMQYDRSSIHDGFFNNVLSLVDTEDIEKVEVLKNGTSLYGAKGSNGVLLITTKRGQSMATRISIRAYGGFEQTPDLLSVMNATQYRNYVTEFLGTTPNAEYLSYNTTIPFMNEDPNYIFYRQYHNETDWQKNLYHEAFTQNYRVNVQGGDDVAKYNLSLGYSQADATAKQNDFNRLNIRFNTDINLFKNFKTELDMAYVRTSYSLRDNGWAESYTDRNISSPNVLGLIQSPFIDPYTYFVRYNAPTEEGGQGHLSLEYTDKIYAGMNYSDSNNPFMFASQFGYPGLANPYWILKNGQGDNKNNQEQTQFSVNIAPTYKVNNYITISDRFSYLLTRSNEKYFMPKSGTPLMEVEGLGSVQSVLRSQFGKETTLFNDFRVDWTRSYGAHFVNLFGGFRMASYSYSDTRVAGYNNDNDNMPNIAYSLQYKDYGGTNDRWVNLAYYVNADYNYKNTYFAKFITTAEASSRFGKEAKDGVKLFGVKWGLFPSLQLGWVMSNEKWFNVKGINYLKLTGGYEMSGNDNVDYYAVRTYFQNVKFLDRATALELANIQNAAMQWETNHRWNIALQMHMLRDHLSLNVEYFNSKTTDLLTRKSVSDITGLSYMWANDGELTNKGVEVTLHGVLVNTKNWKWQAGLSVGHYKNEITKLPESNINTITHYALDENGQRIASSATTMNGYLSSIYGSNNILTAVGYAAGVFYGYQTNGVFSTDAEASSAGKYGYLRYPTGLTEQPYRIFQAGDVHFVDQNGDGWISEADMVKIGDPNPDIYGNFYTSLTWKDLTLDVTFKYSLGNDVYNYQRMQLESGNNIWNQTTAVVNRWKNEGQITDVPRTMAATSEQWVNNERFSDRWIEDGSYLKLKKVRLTYKIPLANNIEWLQGLAVWGEANNVFTVTKYLGSDPEVSCGNSVLYQGIDAGLLYRNRNFNIGVTINL